MQLADHQKIIFFDMLGFGWVVTDVALREINAADIRESLMEGDLEFMLIHRNKRIPW